MGEPTLCSVANTFNVTYLVGSEVSLTAIHKTSYPYFFSNQICQFVEEVHVAFFPGEEKKRGKCAISKKVLQISTRSKSWDFARRGL